MDKRPKILYISNKKVQKAISKPVPKKIIECFYDAPLTASQIAEAVSFPKDKIYYHIKKLLSLNILYVTDTEEIKGITQRISKIVSNNFPGFEKSVFIKTSTGYYGGFGATIKDVKLMCSVSGKLPIKASGGVSNFSEFIQMIEAGASSVGTSKAVNIFNRE